MQDLHQRGRREGGGVLERAYRLLGRRRRQPAVPQTVADQDLSAAAQLPDREAVAADRFAGQRAGETPAQAGPGAVEGQTWAMSTVPFPGTECTSDQLDCRTMAPNPMPSVPAVECPSPTARATSAMPGPRSNATISTPAWSPARTARSSMTP